MTLIKDSSINMEVDTLEHFVFEHSEQMNKAGRVG